MGRALAFAFLLVGTAVFVALGYHLGNRLAHFQWKAESARTLASSAPRTVTICNAESPLDDEECKVYDDLSLDFSASDSPSLEAESCGCVNAPANSTSFFFEKASDCSRDRLYLEPEISRMLAIFRNARASQPSEFPRICTLFIQRAFMTSTEGSESPIFAKCSSPESEPERGAKKACVTETLVNVVHNSFVDVTDCLGIPQLDFLPKLLNESGMHLNAYGRGADAGIGQLVGPTLRSVPSDWLRVRDEILRSEKPSCRAIASVVRDFNLTDPSEADVAKRCSWILPPQNPIKNLLVMGMKYRQDQRALRNLAASRNLFGLFTEAGWRIDTSGSSLSSSAGLNPDRLFRMLISLSYNAGATGSMDLLVSYLQQRVKAKARVGPEQFDLRLDSREVADRLKKLRADFVQLNEQGVRFIPDSKKEEWMRVRRREFPVARLNFFDFLRVYQELGAPTYLPALYGNALRLNTVFVPGTCVPEGYLSLSN